MEEQQPYEYSERWTRLMFDYNRHQIVKWYIKFVINKERMGLSDEFLREFSDIAHANDTGCGCVGDY